MRIAVCDDQEFFVKLISKKIKDYIDNRHFDYQIDTFTDGLNLLSKHKYFKSYDIIFLDVEMPLLSGKDVAQKVNEDQYRPLIIFTTSHTDFAVSGYVYKAFRFLVKANIDGEINSILDDAIKEISNKADDAIVKINDMIVLQKDIVYIEGKGGYVYFYLHNGGVLSIRSTMKLFKSTEKLLGFVHAKESLLVNFNHIKARDKNELKLDNDIIIKIPRTRQEKVRQEIYEIGAEKNG